MAEQIPLVVIGGEIKQLPAGDTIPATAVPVNAIDGGSATSTYTGAPVVDGGSA